MRKVFLTLVSLLPALAFSAIALSAASPGPPAQPAVTLKWISVIASADVSLETYFVGPTYRRPLGQLQRIAGLIDPDRLPDLARVSGVIDVLNDDDRPQPPQPAEAPLPYTPTLPLAARLAQPQSPGSWYENDTQGVRETWNTLNLSGTGVMIAVLDSGVDFGNPALNGRFAIQTATLTGSQAYVGWPIAYDDRSLTAYLANPITSSNWDWYVNASQTITGAGAFTFTLAFHSGIYTAPNTSQSGRYYVGIHPDERLGNAPVLVADTTLSGTYDAVFMDLNNDGVFETKMTRGQPVGALDLNGDHAADVSAGMIYWISDGLNPIPGSIGIYGPAVPIPTAGRLVAFMIDSLVQAGGGHGTECASTAVGNDGGLFTPEPRIPSFYTTTYGPLVQGPAPAAKIMAIGNIYAGGSVDAPYLFTLLGYDGVPHSGDEPLIASLSFGNFRIDNDGYDWESRYIDYLAYSYEDQYGPGTAPLFIHSAGNGGSGAGTMVGPNPYVALTVGAATQYGTVNAWGISETVSAPDRVNYGDVAAISDRGPAADGVRVINLVANGYAGTGAYPVNNNNDGSRAYVTWTGTSRSSPVVAGMAALTAQAFKQTTGRFPTYQELKQLLINSGRDLGYAVTAQGAGQANVYHAAQLALNQYGLRIDPPVIAVTTPRLSRGQTLTQSLTLKNVGAVPITAALRTQQLIEIAHYTATINTLTNTTTNYAYGVPDYALNLTPWIAAHPEADLMVVRLTVPFEHFDTLPPAPPAYNNAWRLMVYNWWDLNHDGQWWTDAGTPDGRVDLNEIDNADQWLRFDYARLSATQEEVSVGRPYTRSIGAGSGGIWAGASHYVMSPGDNRTTLAFDVTFYRHAVWPDVSLSAATLNLAPNSTALVTATLNATTTPYGLQAGAIIVADAGRLDLDPNDRPYETSIPTTWQVAPDLGQAVGVVITDRALGGFNWTGRGEEGDWHYDHFDLTQPPAGSVILAHTRWSDYPTDLDTLILGPTDDNFSTIAPQWFGPYTLDWLGGSVRTSGRPAWNFQTATGSTEEWASAPAREGHYASIQQAVLLGGHQPSVPFTTALGLAYVQPYPLRVDPICGLNCLITATFNSGVDISGTLGAAHLFGWFTPTMYSAQFITAGQSLTYSVLATSSLYELDATLSNVLGAGQLDLALYDDYGGQLAKTNTRSVDPILHQQSIASGQYWVMVSRPLTETDGAIFDLDMVPVPADLDSGLLLLNAPQAVIAGQPYTFTLQSTRPPAAGQRGLIKLGPPYLTDTLAVPIDVEPLADVWISPTQNISAAPGLLTYSVVTGNRGPSDAHAVWLTSTWSFTTAIGTYYWPALAVGETHTWTLTATFDDGPIAAHVTNTLTVAAREFDPAIENNVANVMLAIIPYQIYLPVIVR